MAGCATKTADDHVGPQRLACAAHRFGAVAEMDTVKAQPLAQPNMIAQHQGDIARMGHLAASICSACDHIFIPACQIEPHTGHRAGIQNTRQLVGKLAQFKTGWRNQIDLRLLGCVHCHAFLGLLWVLYLIGPGLGMPVATAPHGPLSWRVAPHRRGAQPKEI